MIRRNISVIRLLLFVLAGTSSLTFAQALPKFAAECAYSGGGTYWYRMVSDSQTIYFGSFLNAENMKYTYSSIGRINVGERAFAFDMMSPMSNAKYGEELVGAVFNRQTGEFIVKQIEYNGQTKFDKYDCRKVGDESYGDIYTKLMAGHRAGLAYKQSKDDAAQRQKSEKEKADIAKKNAPNQF